MLIMCISGSAGWGQVVVSITDCAVRSPNSSNYDSNNKNNNARPCTHEQKVGEGGGGVGGGGEGHVLPTIHGADVATGWIPSKKYSCISHHITI
jgi:hypothetical protein